MLVAFPRESQTPRSSTTCSLVLPVAQESSSAMVERFCKTWAAGPKNPKLFASPWVKIQKGPPVNIPIPTKRGSKTGGAPTLTDVVQTLQINSGPSKQPGFETPNNPGLSNGGVGSSMESARSFWVQGKPMLSDMGQLTLVFGQRLP